MKSLKESLFDDDLVSEDLTIGDVYKKSEKGETASGMPISMMFNPSKFKHYLIDGLIDIIMDQPIPKDNDKKWCDNLKKIFSKYIKRSWKEEWNNHIDIRVYITKLPIDELEVRLVMNRGNDGVLSFNFVRI